MSEPSWRRTSSCYDELTFEEHEKLEGHIDFRKIKAELLSRLIHNRGRLLDVGCGSGFDIRFLINKDLVVIGLDLSLNMLQQTKKQVEMLGKNVDLVQGDALHLPFRSSVYDMVHSHELSCFNIKVDQDFNINPLQILKEQRRVCKDKGYIVVVLPQKDYEGSAFKPTSEEELRYFFRWANISFRACYYIMGNFSTPKTLVILKILEKIFPRKFLFMLKTGQEYSKQVAFFILAIGQPKMKT